MGKTLAREWLILVAMISTGYGPVDIFATRCVSWTARRGNSRPLVQISVWWTQRGDCRSVRRHQPPQFLEEAFNHHHPKVFAIFDHQKTTVGSYVIPLVTGEAWASPFPHQSSATESWPGSL